MGNLLRFCHYLGNNCGNPGGQTKVVVRRAALQVSAVLTQNCTPEYCGAYSSLCAK